MSKKTAQSNVELAAKWPQRTKREKGGSSNRPVTRGTAGIDAVDGEEKTEIVPYETSQGERAPIQTGGQPIVLQRPRAVHVGLPHADEEEYQGSDDSSIISEDHDRDENPSIETSNEIVVKTSEAPLLTAELVDEEVERQRDEAVRERDEARKLIQGIATAASVIPVQSGQIDELPAGHAVVPSKKYWMAGFFVATMAAVTIAVSVVLLGKKGPQETPSATPSVTPSVAPSANPSAAPSAAPSATPTGRVFDNREALLTAIDDYLESLRNSNGTFQGQEDISTWDISRVTNLSEAFSTKRNPDAALFDSDLSSWDTSNVTDMSWLFYNASRFNRDVSQWDVSKVETMAMMFSEATNFQQDISSWNTSSVRVMTFLFANAPSFNYDISTWDVSKVEEMDSIFDSARTFNQPLSTWNTSSLRVATLACFGLLPCLARICLCGTFPR